MNLYTRLAVLLFLMISPLVTTSRSAQAEDGVVTGEFVVEPATLRCLGFEWVIRGDDNHNASVEVQYRKQGEDDWRQALPLLRIGDEKVWRSREFLEHWTPRMFAGSILDLKPDTEYECRLTMVDPDGVRGKTTQIASVRTRGIPKPYQGGRVLHVYAPGYTGPREEPSFTGLKEAYYGPGHVICHNYVAFFHDGICICTHGPPEREQSNKSVAIDIYNNEIFLMVDDFIETDGGTHNIRVMRNRGFNAAHHGLSAQPLFGGPAYFIRNVIYNVPLGGGVKYGGANPAGVLVYHNTFIAENRNAIGASNVHYQNNLFLGTDHPEKAILRSLTYSSYSTFDYNGYRPNQNEKLQFWWKAPSPGTLRNYDLRRDQLRGFGSLADFQQATGQETHGLEVDYDIFRKCTPPDASQPHAVYRTEDYDFRLLDSATAVDAGISLPNVNDDHTGAAPDLGALETGQPVPAYGPRTRLHRAQ